MATVAGVDGCKAGWCAVLWDTDSNRFSSVVTARFDDVLSFAKAAHSIAVDMPVGLLDHAVPGGRVCDVYARRMLHPNRMSSVFSPPVRGTLTAQTYEEALALNRSSSHYDRGLSKQCFGLLPKIREMDLLLTPKLQERVREVHPELSFLALNHGCALSHPKRTPEGRVERVELLIAAGFAPLIAQTLGVRLDGAEPDDLLDAGAACWTARRIAEKCAESVPREPHLDARGLRMAIWY